MAVLLLVALVMSAIAACHADQRAEPSAKTFVLETFDKVTIRASATTQVAIEVKQWPHQRFLFWFPEDLEPLWRQWDADIGRQQFVKTECGGLQWTYNGQGRVTSVTDPLLDAS